MKFVKLVALVAALFFSGFALAANLVSNAKVTKVQVYETTDGTTNVWIWINGDSRVGPNPTNPAVTCELWTHSKTVHASALAAMLAGSRVDVAYVDSSNGSFWCKVESLAVVNG